MPRSAAERAEITARLLAAIADETDEHERKLLQDEVVVVNMSVARSVAARYRGRGISSDDLFQVAYVGLVMAARGFDPAYEKNFLSYAVPTITGHLKRHFRDQAWAVRPPRRIQDLQPLLTRAANELLQKLSARPTSKQLAKYLGVSDEEVVEALTAGGCFSPASLDAMFGHEGWGLFGDRDPDLERAEVRMMLAPAVRRLGERDRLILCLRFFSGWSQQQIGDELGVTQMQVSRLLARILGELRASLSEPHEWEQG
ncbi:MAG: sigma-70 family RNA polymerase sigma factor [Nocardioidaceae bacterium]